MAAGARQELGVTDLHVGGDVSRVILDGLGVIPGDSLASQANYLAERADGLRRMLLSEPHGNPSMSADLVVPPKDPAAEAGFIVMEAMGYPGFSGTNAICTVTALLEAGRLPMTAGARPVVLESPAGRVRMTAECRDGRVLDVSYRAAPACVHARDLRLEVTGHGTVSFDLVASGVLYPVVEAAALGCALGHADVPQLAAFGRAFVAAARAARLSRFATGGAASEISFVLFAGPLEAGEGGVARSATAVYVHPDVICRSPTGTGTSARLALLAADGRIEPGATLRTASCLGSTMTGKLIGPAADGPTRGFATEIAARAYTLSRGRIVVDPADPVVGPVLAGLPLAE